METRTIQISYEVTARAKMDVEIPAKLNNDEVEDWLDRHGKLDEAMHKAEDKAEALDFESECYSITDERGRDIVPW
jgi:hypothetical protein